MECDTIIGIGTAKRELSDKNFSVFAGYLNSVRMFTELVLPLWNCAAGKMDILRFI